MTRSRRRTPIFGNTTARSDKDTKVAAHRSRRVAERSALAGGGEFPDDKQFGDPCLSNKDGKQYSPGYEQEMRK